MNASLAMHWRIVSSSRVRPPERPTPRRVLRRGRATCRATSRRC